MRCLNDGEFSGWFASPGKMQFGSGWWFLDQIDGMTRQIEALSQLGLLSQFVGMITDSRSFLVVHAARIFPAVALQYLGQRYPARTAAE